MKKRASLFSRLILSVAIPEILMFSLLAYISFIEVYQLIKEENKQQSDLIQNEVEVLVEFMNVSAGIIESELNDRLMYASDELVNYYLRETDSVKTQDLNDIQLLVGLDYQTEQINVIDSNAVVINSSDIRNIGVDYKEYGDIFNQFILSVKDGEGIVLEKFNYDLTEHIIKKFSYIPTRDHRYVIELEFSSRKGNTILNQLRKSISKLAERSNEILSIDLIFGYYPHSFVTKAKITDSVELAYIDSVKSTTEAFINEKAYQFENLDEKNLAGVDLRDKVLILDYTPLTSEKNNLFSNIIVREVKDAQYEQNLVRLRLTQKIAAFLAGMLLLFVVLLLNARILTRPLKKLLMATRAIGDGKFDERVKVRGSREIQELGQSLNEMAKKLDDSNKRIVQQRDKIESAHKEIRDSINYAKRIQSAILPPFRIIQSHLNDSFVLYLPKDVVAGDFYWIEKQKDKVFFAAADCTGHGVPGAMVSVICNNGLNRSVREYGMSDPAKILNKTREIVIQEFEKSDEEVKDGMDIALCALNGYTLEYAGAHNPLWIIRGNEILETKADKQPIGKFEHTKDFTSHSIQLEKGDIIYIFSDGFVDQFGGPKGKKFMSKRLKKLLLSIKEKPMDSQREELKKSFNDWKGEEAQVDDVCLIGVRV